MANLKEIAGYRTFDLSPEAQRVQQVMLDRQSEGVLSQITLWNEQKKAFGAKYGEDLLTYTNAFVNRAHNDSGQTLISGRLVPVDSILDSYARELVGSLEEQSEACRNDWMVQYLRDAEGLRRE